jgi:hypothetical protein
LYPPFKKGKFAVFIALLLTCISPGVADYVSTVKQVEISGLSSDSSTVIFLADVIREAEPEFESFFDGNLKAGVSVHLAATEEAYFRLAETKIPDWSGAVAFPERRVILMKPGSYFDPDVYRETILHELSHIYLADLFNSGKIPLWMNEGCAMHLSKQDLTWEESIILGNSFASGHIVGLDAIDDLLRFGPAKARLAYLESFTAVRFFIQTYGAGKFRDLLKDFSAGYETDQNFDSELGLYLSDFEDAWYQAMKHKFRWVIFLQVENILWISLVLISIAVFIGIRIRNRKTVRNWQETNDIF